MIIRYTKATKAAADQPVKSSAIVGKDKQQLVFNISITNQIALEAADVPIFKWEGSGKIEAIQSVSVYTDANIQVFIGTDVVKFANNLVSVSVPAAGADAKIGGVAIPANAKMVLTLIIGQTSAGA